MPKSLGNRKQQIDKHLRQARRNIGQAWVQVEQMKLVLLKQKRIMKQKAQ
jgi:hypothetical protein